MVSKIVPHMVFLEVMVPSSACFLLPTERTTTFCWGSAFWIHIHWAVGIGFRARILQVILAQDVCALRPCSPTFCNWVARRLFGCSISFFVDLPPKKFHWAKSLRECFLQGRFNFLVVLFVFWLVESPRLTWKLPNRNFFGRPGCICRGLLGASMLV